MSPPTLDKVIIAGGSLSGLMHALTILTTSPSTHVTILERSPSALLHNQGAGVVAGADVQDFFNDYVRAPGEIAVTSKQRLYLAHDGSIVDGSVEDREQRMTSWDVLYRLLRWRVDGMDATSYLSAGSRDGDAIKNTLFNDGSKARYLYGCTVTEVVDLGPEHGVQVGWTDQSGELQTASADLLIAADGASSSVRRIFLPAIERKYVGYVAFRGTVPETAISGSASKAFVEKFAFFHAQGTQILAYLIPGEEGSLKAGERLVNWVWYCNYEDGGDDYEQLMTDREGHRHGITLPVGGMQDEVWAAQKEHAARILPPQFAELVAKTTQPFVQAVTDVLGSDNVCMGGKVLLVGDALAGFRPHTAASTNQAAFDARALGKWLEGGIGMDEYRKRCLYYAKEVQRHGVVLGERSQFGRHPFSA